MSNTEQSSISEALIFAQEAIKRDDLQLAKKTLFWILKQDASNISAWLLLAQSVEKYNEKLDCYKRVLKLDPGNELAQKQIIALSAEEIGDLVEVMEYSLNKKSTHAKHKPTNQKYSLASKLDVNDDKSDIVEIKLELARRELLDLSLYNKLINYRPLKTKGVEIIDEKPEQILQITVHEGRTMSFLSIPEDSSKEEDEQKELFDQSNSFLTEEGNLEQPEDDEEDIAKRHRDNKLQTPYKSAILQKRLLNTYYAARTYIEEQGVNTLFLALGMLQWKESSSSQVLRRAPLILIPVEISRSNVRSRFRINYSGDELTENLSLRAKLKTEFGITLPKFSDSEDINLKNYFQEIENEIKDYPDWSVDQSRIALAFFSYGRFLMFNDLDLENWPEDERPTEAKLLRALLDEGFQEKESQFDDDSQFDNIISEEKIFTIVDADSSQTSAILDVNNGRNLIIQGPPGTGKSQTITNLIAEALGNGKTVLFVSEKMAALEVVKRRLDSVGIGDACLELHSQKTKKKVVLDELRRSLELGQPKPYDRVNIRSFKKVRNTLNKYSEAVNTEIEKSGVKPYDAYGNLILLNENLGKINEPKFNKKIFVGWSSSDYKKYLSDVEEFQTFLGSISVPKYHPFWGCKRQMILPDEKHLIKQESSVAEGSIIELKEKASKIADTLSLPDPKNRSEVNNIVHVSEYIMGSPDLDGVIINSNEWNTKFNDLKNILQTGYKIQKLKYINAKLIKKQSWGQDVSEIKCIFQDYGTKIWRILYKDYRRANNEFANLCVDKPPNNLDTKIEILESIEEYQRLKSIFEGKEPLARRLYGEQWQGNKSNWKKLLEITNWLNNLHGQVEEGKIPEQVINYLETSKDLENLKSEEEQVTICLERHSSDINSIVQITEFDGSSYYKKGFSLVECNFKKQTQIISNWESQTDRITEIIAYNHLSDQLTKDGLEEIINVSLEWKEANNYLVDLFNYSWFSYLIEKAMKERPILARFNSETHNHTIDKFCEYDNGILNQNRIRLAIEHWNQLPKYSSKGQLGILQHEFSKKRRHKPIRRLLKEAGNAIQVIKPVFMMSPLSIAMFLSPESIKFDLVIFDEASQVKPVDAFGAILRGKQIVVVGDTHQLPPTSFFESAIDVDESEPESITLDLESILGLCYSQGVPSKMLRWHYRSHHESLIAVSDYEFYNNMLVLFPSPDLQKENVGLIYHYLPDTEYGRGKSRANILEARKVAEAVMHHAKKRYDQSLGVATFSMSQMQAIQDQLEILRRLDPTCETFFNNHPEEPFFVKNLENVQGDERDVIYISVGYGRTAEGYISMNFGPLNRDGGERRLNVLITRARKRCEIFTNLTADDIDLSRTNARGVQVLKRYLKYAQTGQLDIPTPRRSEGDSPFEDAVGNELRNLGYRVEHQIGTGGFFIDLAIIDEEQPGRYLLGIECDGATYHSAKSARDRDRLRQEVLENLGWNIHRIWSTDWFQNQTNEISRLVDRIEYEKKKRKNKNPKISRSSHNSQVAVIEREEPQELNTIGIPVEEYILAQLDLSIYKNNLHNVSGITMAQWICDVVNIESPIHVNEVVRRIVNCAGQKRVGIRIQDAFDTGVYIAVNRKAVIERGNFLWKLNMEKPILRNRANLTTHSRKIEYIEPKEIALAIEKCISISYGIKRDNISPEVGRLFGFGRVSEDARKYIEDVLDKMVKEKRIMMQGNFMTIMHE